MVWNAAGTFHTRLSATALTANRKFVFPDLDGTFVVSSAGAVTIDRLVLSSGNVIYGTAQANAVELALSASLTTTLSAYVVELAPGRTIAGATLIDFHAAVGTNTDFRLVRFEGVSGTAVIQQVGGGPLILDASQIAISTLFSASAVIAQTVAIGGTLTVSGTASLRLIALSPASTDPGFDSGSRFWFESGVGTHYDAFTHKFDVGNTTRSTAASIAQGSFLINAPLTCASTLTASATASFIGSIFTGGIGASTAPYAVAGSIVSTAGAAARFRNTSKCWVEFIVAAGVVTLNTQFNVSAITRASSGVYAVNLKVASLATSFPCIALAISGTAGTIVRAGGLTSTQSFGITTTVGTVATDASAVSAVAYDQES